MASIADDPFGSSPDMKKYAQGLRSGYKSEFEMARALFDAVKDDGKLGIKYSYSSVEPREHGTKTALDVWKDKSGDCDELTGLYNALVKLAGMKGAQGFAGIGYANVDIDYRGEEVGHMCAVVFIKGDVPEKFRYKDFEGNKKFRESTLKTAGIADSKDMHMVLVDLTYEQFGAQHKKISVLNEKEALAFYYWQAGTGFKAGGRAQVAEKCFEKALDYAKGSARAQVYMSEGNNYAERGMAYRAIGKTLEGVASGLAHRNDMKYEQKVQPKVTLEQDSKNTEKRIKKWNYLAPKTDGGAAACMKLGRKYLITKKYDKALDYFERVLGFDSKNMPANYFAAMACKEKEDYGGAIGHLKKVVAVDDSHADAHYWLGVSYLKTREYGNAAREFEKTLKLAPDYPYAKYNLTLVKMYDKARDSGKIIAESAKHMDPSVLMR
ncbi:Lipopolysaccharide assembly protein B [Candidatus Gugararchaeum adminiculabundum]|nr:Lipopolysaccharide assembly protein B [Candidatus Gugararchaeum adminiculabundum]